MTQGTAFAPTIGNTETFALLKVNTRTQRRHRPFEGVNEKNR